MKRLKQEYMKRNGNEKKNDLCVMATGGGAYKYYDRIKAALGVEVMQEDEMECLIIGIALAFWRARKSYTNTRQVSTSSYQRSREKSSATAIRTPWHSYRPRQEHIHICSSTLAPVSL